MGSQALAVLAAMLVENARARATVIARTKRRNDMSGSSRPHRRILSLGPSTRLSRPCRWK